MGKAKREPATLGWFRAGTASGGVATARVPVLVRG